MRILLVGAGAVGQAYGLHLQKGGAEAYFYVKPQYAQKCERGFSLYPLNRANPRGAPVTFKANGVLSTTDEVAATRWDQVYLCMSSTGLRGTWIESFSQAIGEATVIMLQPALDDRDFVLRHVPASRLVSGMISIVSYHAPLEGEAVSAPGVAYWVPPLSPNLFSGPKDRVQSVVQAFERGGMPARVVADVSKASAFAGAALMALVSALEASDWSFSKLSRSPLLAEACRAVSEMSVVVAKRLGTPAPIALRLVRPWLLRSLLFIAPKAVPFDLETYFRAHFSKVGDQTRFMMKGYLDTGRSLSVKSESINTLYQSLP